MGSSPSRFRSKPRSWTRGPGPHSRSRSSRVRMTAAQYVYISPRPPSVLPTLHAPHVLPHSLTCSDPPLVPLRRSSSLLLSRSYLTLCQHLTLPIAARADIQPFIPPGHTPDTLSSRPFHIYDPAFLALLGPNPSLTLLAEHPSNPLFHEACVWHPSTKSVFFAQNAGAHAAGTGLEKSAILQRISLDEVEALVEREKKGLRGEGEYVKVETVGETPQVINPNGGILWDDGGIVFAGEGQGEEIASALYLVNPRPPYNTTGESLMCLLRPHCFLCYWAIALGPMVPGCRDRSGC